MLNARVKGFPSITAMVMVAAGLAALTVAALLVFRDKVLAEAARHNWVIAVKLAFAVGADPNSDEYGRTAFHEAVCTGNQELVQLFLDHGAGINFLVEGLDQAYPLDVAIESRQEEIALFLLKQGANPFCQASRAPGLAARNGLIRVLEAIFTLPAARAETERPSQMDRILLDAIDFACYDQERQTQVVKFLLDRGVDPNQAADGVSALSFAIESCVECIGLQLLEAGANPAGAGDSAHIPIIEAVRMKMDTLAVKLIELGADVNARDRTGMTALHQAVWRANKYMVERLLNAGADINARDDRGKVPFDYPTTQEIRDLLLARGASVSPEKPETGPG